MCGITGSFDPHAGRNTQDLTGITRRMSLTLTHRGPDDMGVWIDPSAAVALGHRRLSIIDLTAEGHQPMVSSTGRYVLTYNGEIYNHPEIRAELKAVGSIAFRGSSDTEVMLAAFECWGIKESVLRFNGMFAFAVWDSVTRTLTLARDRAGEKPLYCGWMQGAFLFGSELKALRAHPAFHAEIDRGALALFIRHGYVPGPHSIYRRIWKLPPATILEIDAASDQSSFRPEAYWSAEAAAVDGIRNPLPPGDEAATDRLDAILTDAVEIRMTADVPLGAFLSGGIDSSTVVALMQKVSTRPVKTFTLGFREAGYDEAADAARIAKHFGCDHTEFYVEPAEARDIIPLLPALYDEPFADSSQIPTYVVSKLARKHVTVSLSGDGGDELFGGYTRYQWAPSIWERMNRIPAGPRLALARLLTGIPYGVGSAVSGAVNALLPAAAKVSNPGDKLQKLADLLGAESPKALYLNLVSQWNHPEMLVRDAQEPPTRLSGAGDWNTREEFLNGMMLLDSLTYLPDDILAKVDRASMGVSLESRVPLLDHRVIEFAWHLPHNLKIRQGVTKWLLRQVLYRYVPRELVERPKSGFGVPVHVWLRGPLRDWAETLLDADRLWREGFFNPGPIRAKWAEHLSGRCNHSAQLWTVLMFQAWLEAQGGSEPPL